MAKSDNLNEELGLGMTFKSESTLKKERAEYNRRVLNISALAKELKLSESTVKELNDAGRLRCSVSIS